MKYSIIKYFENLLINDESLQALAIWDHFLSIKRIQEHIINPLHQNWWLNLHLWKIMMSVKDKRGLCTNIYILSILML